MERRRDIAVTAEDVSHLDLSSLLMRPTRKKAYAAAGVI